MPNTVTRSVWTPANVVTMVRIGLSPVVVAAIYFFAPAWWVLIFGFFAMITDKVDGWLARRYGVTHLGIFLDPLADKLMVLGAFAALVALGWVWWVPAALIAAREVGMSWWRSRLASQGISAPSRQLAKFKTWSQSVTVAFALTPGVISDAKWILDGAVWISVALTLYTFAQYVHDGLGKEAPRRAV